MCVTKSTAADEELSEMVFSYCVHNYQLYRGLLTITNSSKPPHGPPGEAELKNQSKKMEHLLQLYGKAS